MVTIAHSFSELAQQAEALGLRHVVEPGDIYWIPNHEIEFGDCSMSGRHPVLVTRVDADGAEVCILTSKIRGNRHNGICCQSIDEAGLRKSGVVLTKAFGRRRLNFALLTRPSFSGRLPAEDRWIVREALQWPSNRKAFIPHPSFQG